MTDKLLEIFFEPKRWKKALDKGAAKGIAPQVLRELSSPEGRQALLCKMIAGEYHITRPHTARIPKDDGTDRIVYVNIGLDRIVLSIINDMLFEYCHDMIDPHCVSYQTGIGCAKVVTEASNMIEELSGNEHGTVGFKADLSKYFDSVPIEYIDRAFDGVEARHGKSVIIDIVREYYHNDAYYDTDTKTECSKYQSLKQGCAVASWLADVVLAHMDKTMNGMGYYVRYSDDILYIGQNYEQAMDTMRKILEEMQMKLNPKKVELLTNEVWFKFLGFSICGSRRSLSGTRLKTFQKEIADRTYKKLRVVGKRKKPISYKAALHSVQLWLYIGDGEHSWATGVLKAINVKHDIAVLNNYVMDCLRAVMVGKQLTASDIGGLGWTRNVADGCIGRGPGRKVKTLREKTGDSLDGYYSLNCMRKNLLCSRDLYNSIIDQL